MPKRQAQKVPEFTTECVAMKVVGTVLVRDKEGKVIATKEATGEIVQANFEAQTVPLLAKQMEEQLATAIKEANASS